MNREILEKRKENEKRPAILCDKLWPKTRKCILEKLPPFKLWRRWQPLRLRLLLWVLWGILAFVLLRYGWSSVRIPWLVFIFHVNIKFVAVKESNPKPWTVAERSIYNQFEVSRFEIPRPPSTHTDKLLAEFYICSAAVNYSWTLRGDVVC